MLYRKVPFILNITACPEIRDHITLAPRQVARHRAKLRGTAPALPCARGVPFILNIIVQSSEGPELGDEGHKLSGTAVGLMGFGLIPLFDLSGSRLLVQP